MAHLGEFLYHKITFQNNDEERMFENLERSFSNPLEITAGPAIPFTARDRLTLFSDKTMTRVQPYVATLISSATLMVMNSSQIWGRGTDGYTNHVVASFSQRLVTYGLQSGAAAALHEDLRYRPSLSRNVWKRSEHALFSTLLIETPRGNDVAFANVVAAFGSAAIINASLPGRKSPNHPRLLTLTGENLLGFAEANLWNEFKPDLKYLLRRRLRRRP